MKPHKKLFALVTGASKGLGRSLAKELAKQKYNVLLVACKNEGLAQLSRSLESKYNVKTDYFETDLTDLNEIDRLVEWVSENYNINILINNAGLGGSCQFEKCSLTYIDNMIKLNIRALTMLSHQFLPMLKAHDRSYILNVSSMAAFSPVGYKTIYPASKRFVQDFSLGLGEELKNSRVAVSVVHPGGMRTNKFVTERLTKHNFLVRAGVIPTDIVAAKSLQRLFRGKKVTIVGWANYLMWFLMVALPNYISLPLMTNAVRNELLMMTKTEAS
jgi:uncharacterized protein